MKCYLTIETARELAETYDKKAVETNDRKYGFLDTRPSEIANSMRAFIQKAEEAAKC